MKKTVLNENIRPNDMDTVRVKEMGNIIEIMYAQHRNFFCPIQKMDSEHYVDKRTGEVKKFAHIGSRVDDKNSVRVSLGKLRDLINANVINPEYCLWITLTYAENMTDPKRLYDDFRKFIQRLKYKIKSFEYIVAMEPQGRGAWHAHMIMIFDKKAPYIPNAEMQKIWGFGFVSVKSLENVDNIGAYLTAYLGDMELEEYQNAGLALKDGMSVKFLDDTATGTPKAIIKGARLQFYPPNFNLYRCSRGIKKPEKYYTTEKEAEKKVSGATLTFECTVEISDTETDFNNRFNYRQFNIRRKQKQE